VNTPYADQVGDRDPVEVLATSLADYQALTRRLTPTQWATPWAPGKWTTHQVVVHVTQWEMIFGLRLRCGLAVPGYVVQPFDQDPFMFEAAALDGPTAFRAFEAVRQMNLALARSLTAADRAKTVQHPQRGTIDIESLLLTLAGHPVHHYKQIGRPQMDRGVGTA
jgi:DinB superfamily